MKMELKTPSNWSVSLTLEGDEATSNWSVSLTLEGDEATQFLSMTATLLSKLDTEKIISTFTKGAEELKSAYEKKASTETAPKTPPPQP